VRNVAEALDDPHLLARGTIATVRHHGVGAVRMVDSPIRLSDLPGRRLDAPPTAGAHTESILTSELGFGEEDLRALRQRQVI
jgi:formyl-CoA transferase